MGRSLRKIIRLSKAGKNSIFSKIQKAQAAAQAANKSATATTTEPTETPEQKALRLASAVTSNGRTTPTVNNTTSTPATSETVDDGLLEYVGDVRNRASRRKRGAPMANNQGTLGQPTILGV